MRIAVINYSYGIGSTGRLAQQIEENANPERYQFQFFCKKSNKNAANIYILSNRFWFLLEGIHSRITGKQGYGMRMATKQMIRYLDKWNPDIIHLHTMHGNYINFPMVMEYCASRNIPVLWNLHDCWAFTGKCGHYTAIGCDYWNANRECRNCPDIHNYPQSYFFDCAHEMYLDKKRLYEKQKNMKFIAVSDWLLEEAKKSSLLHDFSITCIHNWVDTNKFVPLSCDRVRKLKSNASSKYLLVSVASDWSLKKGLGRVVELAKYYPKNVHIILIGQCHEKNLPRNISVIGKVSSQKEMAEYYSAADALLNLSIEETFGLTTAESLACGTPAIVLNTSACPEVVGDCGVVIDTFTPEAVMKAIERIKQHPDQYSVEHCRKRTLEMYSSKNVQRYFKEYDEIYKEGVV